MSDKKTTDNLPVKLVAQKGEKCEWDERRIVFVSNGVHFQGQRGSEAVTECAIKIVRALKKQKIKSEADTIAISEFPY